MNFLYRLSQARLVEQFQDWSLSVDMNDFDLREIFLRRELLTCLRVGQKEPKHRAPPLLLSKAASLLNYHGAKY